jgi:glycosyltransferase involved in cell wall biosynthesis
MAVLFVMLSTGQGFGIVPLETIASGAPAIGLDVAGAPDAFGDGELGITASQGDRSAVIDLLLSALNQRPSKVVRARFGREAFAIRVRDVLDKLRAAA